jgi:signal transduction histidine kinase
MSAVPVRTNADAMIARLVMDLADQQDPVLLVERASSALGEFLHCEWSIVTSSGDTGLGEISIVQGSVASDSLLADLGFDAPHPRQRIKVSVGQEAAGFHLALPHRSACSMALGPVPPPDVELWREAINGVARYLSSRLVDILEARRAIQANKALERRISDLSLLFKGLDVTLSSVELTKVLRAFLTCVTSGEAIGFNRAFLLLLDEDAQELRGTVAVGPSSGEEARTIWSHLDEAQWSLEEVLRRSIEDPEGEPVPGSLADRIRHFVLPLSGVDSLVVRAATSNGIYNIHVYRGEQPEPFADAFGADEFVVIPILGRERTLGVIVADNLYSGKTLAMDRVYLLSGLANHVGVVIENALMFEDISSRYAELNEVQYINRALLSSTGYVEVLRQIAQICASMLQASGTLLFRSTGDPVTPRLEMQYNALGPSLPETVVARCTELALETLDRNTGVLDFDLEPEGSGESAWGANLVSAPMTIDNEVVGVIVVYRSWGDRGGMRRFDRHAKRILSIIADQAAIAVLSGRHMQTIREDQKQIDRLNELLYRNEKLAALGQASSQIAHEIRNPLTALGGFARRIRRSPGLKSRDREAVDVIVTETERLERILSDQLDFVRSARLQRKPTQLNELVHQSLELLSHLLEAKEVHVALDLQKSLPEVRLDGDRIKQVLVNLLMNAIAAVESGGHIGITTRTGTSQVTLEVANDGTPIPAEVIESIFVPFATTRTEGTGLGLVVVHQIVTEHKGEIEVESYDPDRTVFRIRLPRNA